MCSKNQWLLAIRRDLFSGQIEKSTVSSVSVIVPCYNYASYLRGCVESVLSQEGVDVRILIIDDASPDNTPEVGMQLAKEDSRVEYRRHSVNQKHIATYNEGLAWASGDHTLLLSADDMLTPGALVRAARVMDAHPEVGLVYGRQILLDNTAQSGSLMKVREEEGYRLMTGPAFVASLCCSASNPVNTPTAVIRTSLLARTGGYRADLPHTADMELWLRFGLHGSVAFLESEQAYKRMHGANMQLDYTQGALRDLQGRHAAFDRFFEQCSDSNLDRKELHIRAIRTLAEEAFWAASGAFDRGHQANCQALLDYSLSLCPDLAASSQWSRLSWKRRMGPQLWSWVRPVIDKLRAKPSTTDGSIPANGLVKTTVREALS